MASKTSLRKSYPGKYVFSFMVASPERGGPAAEYEGELLATSNAEMFEVIRKLLAVIEGTGQ